jgi:hypothetical protein
MQPVKLWYTDCGRLKCMLKGPAAAVKQRYVHYRVPAFILPVSKTSLQYHMPDAVLLNGEEFKRGNYGKIYRSSMPDLPA